MLRVGLPKGVLKEKSLRLVELLLNMKINKNLLSFNSDEYKIFLLKHRDIPKMIANNMLDIGITSSEWISESKNKVKIIKKMDWCNTRISLITSDPNYKVQADKEISCVTEFPNIAKDYFDKINQKYNIYNLSGSSEAFVPGMFECCVDCVETGSTIRENNLFENEVILESEVVLITSVNKSYDENSIQKIIDSIDEV